MKGCVYQEREMFCSPWVLVRCYTLETRAGWCREETIGSLIRASVNENSQFTNLDAHIHTCAQAQGGGTLDGALKFMCEWKLWGCFCCVFTGFLLP